MDTDSFIIYIETEDFYKEIAHDVKNWFDTSNYDKNDERPLPIGENKKVISLFKDELGGKIIIELVALRAKAYTYRIEDGTENKKAKGTKKCIIKGGLRFQDYQDSLHEEKKKKSQQGFRSDHYGVYIEQR